MRVIGLHHVAFAHQADAPTIAALRDHLGLETTHTEEGDGFVERMLPIGNDCYLQLLEAQKPGIVSRFVERRGAALHHIALAVSDIDLSVTDLARKGVRLVDEVPRSGGMGTRIAFIHPSEFGGLLVELVEEPPG